LVFDSLKVTLGILNILDLYERATIKKEKIKRLKTSVSFDLIL